MSRIEDLYQQGTQEQSPVALDNLILNAAKQSCEEKTTPRKNKTWLYALPSAAVVIMSLSVILNLQHENQDMMTAPSVESIPQTQVSAPKPLEPLKKVKPKPAVKEQNQALEDGFNTVTNQMPTTGIEYKQTVKKPQKLTLKKEKISNTSTSSLEAVVGAVTADSAQDRLMEKEKDEETTNRSKFMYQQQYKSRAKRQKTPSLQSKISILKILIAEKKKKQAQELLNSLKINYPEHDFKEFDEMVLHMEPLKLD